MLTCVVLPRQADGETFNNAYARLMGVIMVACWCALRPLGRAPTTPFFAPCPRPLLAFALV